MSPRPRILQQIHALPGRTRLRCSWLRDDVGAARALAAHLGQLPGMITVRVRPYTGSVLCRHRTDLDAPRVVAAVRELGRPDLVLGPHERPPLPPPPEGPSRVARLAVEFFREVDQEVRRATDGAADVATLATLGFFGAGALEVAVKGELPPPPWFNLAWWGFRTFMSLEGEAIQETRRKPPGAGATSASGRGSDPGEPQ